MTHEKRGVIEEGRTPPDNSDDQQKRAGEVDQYDHPSRRAADAARDSISGNGNQDQQ